MPYLAEILLFLAPFAIFALWRRFNPSTEPSPRVLWLALAGVGCGLVGAVWYGFSVRTRPHAEYVPARIGEDGRVIPGQAPR
jgi:drug/metabolite transporter (DMT)-like permease